MVLSTLNGLATALAAASSQRRSWVCDSTLGNSTSFFYDHWFATHSQGLPATPATIPGELLTNTSPGAIPMTAPGGGNTLYLAGLDIGSYLVGNVVLYDRLWQVGGLDQSINTLQTITSPVMTRPDANGFDVEIWATAQTAGNFYSPTFTLSYKDHAGSTHSATTVMPSNAFHNQYATFPLNLAAGDRSVSQVLSIQQSAGGAAATYVLSAMRRLAVINMRTAACDAQKDALALGLPRIDSGACLAVLFSTVGGGGSFLDLHLAVVEG